MPTLYHRSGWTALATAEAGDTFSLAPGPQGAEGVGVYFSEGSPVRLSTAEGSRSGQTALIAMPAPARAGWWLSKGNKTKFGKPRTWHTDGKTLAVVVRHVETDGTGVRVLHVAPLSDWVRADECNLV